MLTIRASVFCHLSVSAPTGRTYQHTDEKIGCSTCEPIARPDYAGPEWENSVILRGSGAYCYAPWTADCETSKHERKRTFSTDVVEPDPAEAKKAANLAGEVRRKLAACASFNGGSGRLFIAAEKVDAFYAELNKLRQVIAQSNLEMTSARVEISPLFGKLNTDSGSSVVDTVDKENLATAKAAIDEGIQTILAAIKSGDTSKMREVIRETKMLASMLDGEAGKLATETGNFLARAADRLRDATKLGEQHVVVAVEEARKGAQRFGSLWAEMGLGQGSGEAAPAPEGAGSVGQVPAPAGAGDAVDAPGLGEDPEGSGSVKAVVLAPLGRALGGAGEDDMDAAGV